MPPVDEVATCWPVELLDDRTKENYLTTQDTMMQRHYTTLWSALSSVGHREGSNPVIDTRSSAHSLHKAARTTRQY